MVTNDAYAFDLRMRLFFIFDGVKFGVFWWESICHILADKKTIR
uniref:Uncharacterized protein n=1 Tax=Arundo donax TaxID=35708 RepID=A0A0A8ZJR6_ARUDO